MKKNLLFALMFAAGTTVIGQTSIRSISPVSPVALERSAGNTPAERNSTCADTLQYAIAKEYAFAATPTFYAAPLQGPGEEQSQAFLSTETVNVVGVNFRARVNSANASAIIPVMVYLYTVDAAYKPLARIDSALVTVSTTAALFYNANFAVPRAVTGNYAVAIRPTTAFRVDFILNNRNTGTGGEALSYNKWSPVSGTDWFPNADATNGWGQDFDVLISPIVSYPIATDFTVSPSMTECLGTPMTFTNTTTPAANLSNRMYNYNVFLDYFGGATISDSTYAWDMTDGSPLYWSANASHTYMAAGAFTPTLYTLGGFWTGCVDTKAGAVTINAIDDATITAPSSACISSSSFNLSAVTSGGTWTGTGITNATTGTFDPSVAGLGTHTVTYTTAGACPDTDNVSITVTALDDATISGPSSTCTNSSAFNFTAATTGGTWSGTGVNSSTGSFDPSVAGVGSHVITYTTGGACSATDNMTITVNAVEDATITDPGMMCDDDVAMNLTAATAGGTWSGTGITSSSAGTFDPAVAGAGTHVITYTTAGFCPGTDNVSIVVTVCTGIQVNASPELTIYPNPSTGLFTINTGVSAKTNIEVYNVIGAKVLAKEFSSPASLLDMSGFETGVYFIKVTTDNTQVTKRITVTK